MIDAQKINEIHPKSTTVPSINARYPNQFAVDAYAFQSSFRFLVSRDLFEQFCFAQLFKPFLTHCSPHRYSPMKMNVFPGRKSDQPVYSGIRWNRRSRSGPYQNRRGCCLRQSKLCRRQRTRRSSSDRHIHYHIRSIPHQAKIHLSDRGSIQCR